jgi:hypothetical protein
LKICKDRIKEIEFSPLCFAESQDYPLFQKYYSKGEHGRRIKKELVLEV